MRLKNAVTERLSCIYNICDMKYVLGSIAVAVCGHLRMCIQRYNLPLQQYVFILPAGRSRDCTKVASTARHKMAADFWAQFAMAQLICTNVLLVTLGVSCSNVSVVVLHMSE